MSDLHYRTFRVEPAVGDSPNAAPRGVLTTEQPVEMFDWSRGEYIPEVLLMSGMKSRGKSIKLIDTHNTSSVRNVLGSFENIKTHPAGERDVPFDFADGDINISSTEPEIATKVAEGHINEMSVGYRYSDEKTKFIPAGETAEIDGKTYTGPVSIRQEWEAQEASLVPLGADDEAQIRGYKGIADALKTFSSKAEVEQSNGGGLTSTAEDGNDTPTAKRDNGEARKQPNTKSLTQPKIMKEEIPVDNSEVLEEAREAGVAAGKDAFDKRADAIMAVGEQVNDPSWALSHLRSGASVEEVQKAAIEKLKESNANIGFKTEGDVGLSKKERERYSLSKAMLALAAGKKPDGIEREVSDFISERCDREPDGFFAAPEAFRQSSERADLLAGTIASAGTGGGVVGDDLLAGSFIEALRPNLVAGQAGITILNGLVGNVVLPKQTAKSSASWAGDETTTAHTASEPTFGQVTLEPQHLGCFADVSKQLLSQGTPDVDTLLRDDLSAAIATGLDQAVFRGSGSGQPQGIDGGDSVETSAISTPGQPAVAELFEFVSDVEDGNALNGNLAWVTTPTVAAYLKQTQLYSNTDSTMWDWRNGNTVLGYPAFSSTNADSNDIFFGNWSDYILGIFDGVDIVADVYSGAKNRLVTYIVNVMADGDVRRGQSFCTNA
tara:strand:- start:298 stop:2292 length:1995 start_codon:yes stop_codon:yes gene_type:complete